MSEKLANLEKKGGGNGGRMAETDLWTNSSPSSDWSVNSITLSQSISNFEFLKIYYKPTKSSSTSDVTAILVAVDDFKTFNNTVNHGALFPTAKITSSANWGRRAWYIDDTTMGVNNAGTQIFGTGSNASNIIYTKVCGLK